MAQNALPPPDTFSRFPPSPTVRGEFEQWRTIGYERSVLAVVRTVTTLNRLLDVLTLFAADHRVQVLFTVDEQQPAILGAGVPAVLERLGALVIPWRQALSRPFDLVVAASENDDLQLLDGPVVLLSHGVGFQKYYPGTSVVAGMDPDRLLHEGAVVPALIAVSHQTQVDQLRRTSAAAADRARIVGDPCLDRILASRHGRPDYRAALGADGRAVVAIASTWGPASLFGAHPDLPLRLLTELPYDEFVVCLVLHPGVTAAHGSWQLDAWLTEARQAGLRVVPPEAGWQAVITAADCVIADTGSVALYAAALDQPLLLADGAPATVVPESPAAALAAQVRRLDVTTDLAEQIRTAISHRTSYADIVRATIADPGRSAVLLRSALYELMQLPEPVVAAEFTTHAPPIAAVFEPAAYVVGAQPDEQHTTITRFPATSAVHALDHQHVVAHGTRASLRALAGATIVFTDEPADFQTWAPDTLRAWPDADLVAACGHGHCVVRTRGGVTYTLTPADATIDPLLTATLVHLGRVGPAELIAVGGREVQVTIETA